MATAARRLLTVEEFLALEFSGDEGRRIELSNGTIRLMAGGSIAHARVQQNISGLLFVALRESLCSPFGPDMGVRTHDLSLRYPDVSVFCGRDDPEFDKLLECNDPKLIVEVLSPSTKREDIGIKLPEYQSIASLDAILYVDPDAETIRLLTRTSSRGWSDENVEDGKDIILQALGVKLAWNDVFRRK
jgi:Uma2 family endonuclease